MPPFSVSAYRNDSLIGTEWFDGFNNRKKDVLLHFNDFDELRLNSENNCTEFNRKNNFIRTIGLFKKTKPLKIQFLPGIDDPLRSQLCMTPVAGYNYYNGFMPGLALYNNPVPQKKFSYFLMPMYGITNHSLAGIAKSGFTLLPESKKVQLIWIGITYSHFAYSSDESFNLEYSRLVPEVLIKLKSNNFRSKTQSEIRFRSVNISKDFVKYYFSEGKYLHSKDVNSYYVNWLAYTLSDSRKINPYRINIVAEQGDKFLKASLEGNYRISYNKPHKGFELRSFFGGFVFREFPVKDDFRFRMGGLQGSQDYLFDHYYIGRSENSGLLSQQFCEADGGFKISTAIQTWNWLAAINLKTSVPGVIPLKLFADFGIYEFEGTAGSSEKVSPIVYDAGIQLSVINNIFDIYFPAVISDAIKNENDVHGYNFLQKLRFTLNLEKIDPFKLLRDIR